jgi:hypothetical protein
VAIMDKGEILITTGSDHLDATLTGMSFQNAGREYDPAKSKQLCPAVVARDAWLYQDIKDHWDALQLRSSVTISGKRTPFQDYSMSKLNSLETHLTVNPKLRDDGTVLFSGSSDQLSTSPPNLYNVDAGADGIFPRDFHFEMTDPILGRTIAHGYTVQVLE